MHIPDQNETKASLHFRIFFFFVFPASLCLVFLFSVFVFFESLLKLLFGNFSLRTREIQYILSQSEFKYAKIFLYPSYIF